MAQLTESKQINRFSEAQIASIVKTASSVNEMFAPMVNFQEYFKQMVKPIIDAVKLYDERNRALIQSLVGGLQFPTLNPWAAIEEAEIVPQDEEIEETSLLPVRLRLPAVTQKPVHGLKVSAGGSFSYKGKILRYISLASKHGRLLRRFLLNEFLTDEEIYQQLNLEDERSFSWVLRNLKNALKRNGLEILIEDRKKPTNGYVFIGIEKYTN